MDPNPTDGESRTYRAEDLPDVVNIRDLARGGLVPSQTALVGGTGCEFPCPYCTRPQGYDACPIHRD